jgi:hypothetical protein
MAIVWAARLKCNPRFQKLVALKSIPRIEPQSAFQWIFSAEAGFASRSSTRTSAIDLGEAASIAMGGWTGTRWRS